MYIYIHKYIYMVYLELPRLATAFFYQNSVGLQTLVNLFAILMKSVSELVIIMESISLVEPPCP